MGVGRVRRRRVGVLVGCGGGWGVERVRESQKTVCRFLKIVWSLKFDICLAQKI